MENNRKHERYSVFIRINMYKNAQFAESGKGFIIDISRPGLRIESNFLLAEGTVAVVDFSKQDETKNKLYGKILWRKHIGLDFYQYGIELLEDNKLSQENLQDYILLSRKASKKI